MGLLDLVGEIIKLPVQVIDKGVTVATNIVKGVNEVVEDVIKSV